MQILKYLCLSVLILNLSCEPSKKSTKKESVIKEKETPKEQPKPETQKNVVKKPTKQEILVVIKNPKILKDAKALIENSGLNWKKLLVDKPTLKVGLIEVPIEKKDFWLQRLQESGEFSSVSVNSNSVLAEIKKEFENRLITVEKTECLGDCPVYKVIIYKDGNVLYSGKKFVQKEGNEKFKLTDKQLNKLKEELNKTSFNSYKNLYDGENLMDYPSTFITYKEKQIKIKLWRNVPDALAQVHEIIEGFLLEKKVIN